MSFLKIYDTLTTVCQRHASDHGRGARPWRSGRSIAASFAAERRNAHDGHQRNDSLRFCVAGRAAAARRSGIRFAPYRGRSLDVLRWATWL